MGRVGQVLKVVFDAAGVARRVGGHGDRVRPSGCGNARPAQRARGRGAQVFGRGGECQVGAVARVPGGIDRAHAKVVGLACREVGDDDRVRRDQRAFRDLGTVELVITIVDERVGDLVSRPGDLGGMISNIDGCDPTDHWWVRIEGAVSKPQMLPGVCRPLGSVTVTNHS